MTKDELLKGLTKEQIEKARECNNTEELLELAKAEGVELDDEQLKAITGGCGEKAVKECPMCHHTRIRVYERPFPGSSRGINVYHCENCHWEWEDQ